MAQAVGLRAGLFGATGYTGVELVKLLERHQEVEIVFATSENAAGCTLDRIFPAAPPLPLVAAAEAPLERVDVVFLCLPHATATPTAVRSLAAGPRVVDLSADFRLQDPATYAHWYGQVHAAPELLPEAVYGLTEWHREALTQARLVANPGCYATSILLALAPLLVAQAAGGPIIADSKSGVSGAGRAPKQHTHFVEVSDNFRPYNIGRQHRHLAEMEQVMAAWSDPVPPLIFSPHLLPVPRGILSTIYVPPAPGWTETAVRRLYQEAYGQEPFVHLLPAGELASLAHVNYTNRCVLSLTGAGDMLIVVSAIDNLLKGAAGQAVQNMNVMFGLTETAGLI
jgi:N-acetyl-gamma-glutamyl-phosphate reductase